MNNDFRAAMKHVASFLLLVLLWPNAASGQASSGLLKIFSDNPLVVYVDNVHYPQYSEIKLVPGTHYVKAVNAEGIRVYSEIVSVKANEVTSVLVEVQKKSIPVTQQGMTYGQPSVTTGADLPADNPGTVPKPPAPPEQTIDIGQINGILPADMGGAYGLTFGMNISDVDRIMKSRAASTQRNYGYNVYAIRYGSSVYAVECRFIDQKLFQIIVGYPSVYTDNSKLKLNKKEVPFPEFNRILNDMTAIYGEPATAEKIFLNGYTEDDGRIVEALRRKKALFLYTWTDTSTGNNIMVGLGYTTTPLAAAIYTSGPLGAEAQARKLRLNGYSFGKSFKDNYFSN